MTRQIYARSLVWDAHGGFDSDPETDLAILERWRAAGVDFLSVNVGYDVKPWTNTVRTLAAYRAWLKARADDYLIAATVADVCRARAQGKLAVAFDIEGMDSLAGDVRMVGVYHDLGVRQMLFAYNRNNAAGGGCHDEDTGLTDFGRAAIAEMNRLGMLVDCSHSAYRTTMEAMEASQAPVIFSHSNPAALWRHGRNIADDQIKGCAATGGVVGINGVGIFLGDNDTSSEAIARHVAYVAELVGPEHVGFGLDYADIDFEGVMTFDNAAHYWPPGNGYDAPALDIAAPGQFPEICEQLHAHGFSEAELAAILGGNFLRVAERVWG